MLANTSQKEVVQSWDGSKGKGRGGAFAKRQFFLPRQPGKSKSFLNTNRPKGSTIGAENKRTVWTEKEKKEKNYKIPQSWHVTLRATDS